MNRPAAYLVLANGSVFEGESVGDVGDCVGELVFNTAMTGYQEILTDPSYARQLVMLTTSHVGNTGCNMEDMESSKVWAAGLILRECAEVPSNFRSEYSLPDWLKKNKVVAISGIDTRHLTHILRNHGSIGACITTKTEDLDAAKAKAAAFPGLSGVDLAKIVSRQTIERWHLGRGAWAKETKPSTYHVVVYDFGVKHTILRILYDLGCHLTIVPATTSAKEVLALNPDGVMLSNGPGDPLACDYAIEATKLLLASQVPLLGICLGFQILAIACGATSIKMKFGHHGANHPVIDLASSRVSITSQNHGFAIDEETLPDCLQVTHRSLFDNSLQGIMHRKYPAIGFQGHPEASPGPHDIEGFFNRFITHMATTKSLITGVV